MPLSGNNLKLGKRGTSDPLFRYFELKKSGKRTYPMPLSVASVNISILFAYIAGLEFIEPRMPSGLSYSRAVPELV